MTQDEIIRMAREAGFWTEKQPVWEKHEEWISTSEELERFAALFAAHEREACAKVCIEEAERHEEMSQYEDTADYAERCLVYGKHIRTCAAAIRARGEK